MDRVRKGHLRTLWTVVDCGKAMALMVAALHRDIASCSSAALRMTQSPLISSTPNPIVAPSDEVNMS